MRFAFPLRPHVLGLNLAVLLALPGRALADWGEDWGTMLWSDTGTAVPGLGELGMGLLLGALLAAAAWVLRRRRPVLGLSVLLVALAIPLAVAAGTLSVPHTFVNGTAADADQVNASFDAVETEVNDNDARITAGQAAADTAVTNAATAQTTANTAVTNAATAQTTANTAVTNAATAQTTANTAATNAATAQTTANTAVTNAATAQSTADTAVTNAATAQTTADSSQAILSSEGPHVRPGGGNTAVGVDALTSNTTGSNNTAIGNRALTSNTTGNFNTAHGENSLNKNTTGGYNTAIGEKALYWNLNGIQNTATGRHALHENGTGNQNTAIGNQALFANSTGHENTATGIYALKFNTTGDYNTAVGKAALMYNNTGNNNTAIGRRALYSNGSGNQNIALGNDAGKNLTAGDGNIAIGNEGVVDEANTTRIGTAQDRTFIAGIFGETTDVNDAIAVLIDSSGQLGTISSSGRFKEDVAPMAEKSAPLTALRPVTFRYKKAFAGGEKPIQFGLIAEEVAEVFPELVVFDEEGQPETVKYHLLSSLLLNEFQKLFQQYTALQAEKKREVAGLQQRVLALEALETRLATLEAQVHAGTLFVQASAGSPGGWERPR